MRLYEFDTARLTYEDELPEDMTEADYAEWFKESYVDMVRVGPRPVRLALQFKQHDSLWNQYGSDGMRYMENADILGGETDERGPVQSSGSES